MNHIIFDLEATCWDGVPLASQQEIIEIGAFKLDDYGKIIGEFNAYVKPVLNSTLSVYCKNLTNISQSSIDSAKEFPVVIDAWLDWIEDDYKLIAWGKADVQMIVDDCSLHRYDPSWAEDYYIDLKHIYRKHRGYLRSISFLKAIESELGEFEGEQHAAMNDAYNLTRLYQKYFGEWGI